MDSLLTIVERNNELPNVTLNFDALREEGTAYIAQLGHKLWSDLNTHDPGVTMLEVLCYAINDLAYRTSFPIQDLLTCPPEEIGKELKQFYTAAEILSCCPVTPLDFRKVMIDCEGVKNAWLFKAGAEDQQYYRQYFVEKNAEEMKRITALITAILEHICQTVYDDNFPITTTSAEFISALEAFDLDVTVDGEPVLVSEHGVHLFDFLAEEIEACMVIPDISKMITVLGIIREIDLNTIDNEGGFARLQEEIFNRFYYIYGWEFMTTCAAELATDPLDIRIAQALLSALPTQALLEGLDTILAGTGNIASISAATNEDTLRSILADIIPAGTDYSPQTEFLVSLVDDPDLFTQANLDLLIEYIAKISEDYLEEYLIQVEFVYQCLNQVAGDNDDDRQLLLELLQELTTQQHLNELAIILNLTSNLDEFLNPETGTATGTGTDLEGIITEVLMEAGLLMESGRFAEAITYLLELDTDTGILITDNLELINNFLAKIVSNNYIAQCQAQIDQVLSLFEYSETGDWNLTSAEIEILYDFVEKLTRLQYNFISNDFNVNRCADQVGLNQGLARNLVFSLSDLSQLDRLLSLLNTTRNLHEARNRAELILTIDEQLSPNENPPLASASFSEQVDFLSSFIDRPIYTPENLNRIRNFLTKLLQTEWQFILSERDLNDCLEEVSTTGISNTDFANIAIGLVKRDAENVCLIHDDLDQIIQIFEQRLCPLFDFTGDLPIDFGPCDTRADVIEHIRALYKLEFGSETGFEDFLEAIDPFLWIFSCKLNGNAVIEDLKCLLKKFFERLTDYRDISLGDFVISGQALVNLIEEAYPESCPANIYTNLKPFQNEVIALVKASRLPGSQLRPKEEVEDVRDYFRQITDAIEAGLLGATLDRSELEAGLRNLVSGMPAIQGQALVDRFMELCVCWRVIYCESADIPPGTEADKAVLNGLYTICINLEDQVNSRDTITVNEIKERVLQKLCAYRNLAEDYLAIDVVGEKEVCIDLSVTAADDADVNEIEAHIIYRIQQFFSPCPQFYSLQELLDMGRSCDEIYQGIILQNGFLLDEEVENARLRRVIYKSDLYQEIMDIEGIESVKCLKIWLCNEDDQACAYDNDWCLDICQKEQAQADVAINAEEKYSAKISCKYKPKLKLEGSSICIQKGRVRILTNPQDVLELRELVAQLNRRPPVDPQRDVPVPTGTYRDLDQYFSIQEDFPLVYRVGKDQISDNAPPLRRAQVKQLKGYLTFFDQLLINYLEQLGHVKEILGVCPSAEDRAMYVQSLRGLDPAIANLMLEFYQMNEFLFEKLAEVLTAADLEKLQPLKTLAPMVRTDFVRVVRTALEVPYLAENILALLLEHGITPYFFEHKLAEIVENDLERFKRRNRILDHLIARFGEKFTDYALSLLQVCPDDPCKAPRVKIKDNLLRCKTEFLKCIPQLGSERGKGLNYKAEDCIKKELFWDSDNVAGMKKRVSKLLCLDHSDRVQLACRSKAVVVKKIDEENNCFNFVVVEKDRDPSSPDTTLFLQGLKNFTLRAKGRKDQDRMREALLRANQELILNGTSFGYLQAEEDAESGQYFLRLRSKRGMVAQSRAFASLSEADDLREALIQLIFPNDCMTEGFHVVEHILMRPTSKEVPVLEPIFLQSDCKINDPYSFWVSVIALDDWKRFSEENGARDFFEQTIRRETPAHIGLCFMWLNGEEMFRFEHAYKNWLYDLARQESDECQIEESLTELVLIMNQLIIEHCREEPVLVDAGCGCS